MTTNTPTPAPDLDARVAALRNAAKEIAAAGHAGWGNVCNDAADALEQTLRAELQKPALHEPVGIVVSYSEWELTAQINLVPTMNGKSPVDIGTPLFLQGRVKPALQANAAAVEPAAWRRPLRYPESGGIRGYETTYQLRVAELWRAEGLQVEELYTHPPVPARAQEEITDAERWNYVLQHANEEIEGHNVLVMLTIEEQGGLFDDYLERATKSVDAAIRAAQKG